MQKWKNDWRFLLKGFCQVCLWLLFFFNPVAPIDHHYDILSVICLMSNQGIHLKKNQFFPCWFWQSWLSTRGVIYIGLFITLLSAQVLYILISIFIYFESPFWHGLVALYLQLDIYWSFYRSSFCTLLQLITTNKYWHLTTKLDIELRGLHIAQNGKRIDDFKSYFQHAKKEDPCFNLLSQTCFTFLPSFNRLLEANKQ